MLPDTIKYKTPLTYYGGKQRIASWVVQHIPEHQIYVEPFFGGGAVFFKKIPSYLEVINDLNENLVNFYEMLQLNYEKLAAKVKATLHSESMYKRALDIYHGRIPAEKLEKALATWIVFNQSYAATCRSGWKFDNATGGSHFGIVQHHARENFCPWLKKRLQYVQISCRDALQVIKDRDSERTFFYLDPPYPNANQGHYSGYTFDDLQELLTLLQNIKGKFALSNYPSDMISDFSVRNDWKIDIITFKKNSVLAADPNAQKIEVLLMNYHFSRPRQLSFL